MLAARIRWRDASAATVVALAVVAFLASPAAAKGCANQQRRVEDNSIALPDCRAYELVSPTPAEADGYDVSFPAQAVAEDGAAVAWQSEGAFAGTQSGGISNQYVSRRTGSGWTTEAVAPAFTNLQNFNSGTAYTGWSANLERMVVQVQVIGQPEALYLREPDGTFTLLDPGASTDKIVGIPRLFEGATPSFSRILFTGTGGSEEWNEGAVSPAPQIEVDSQCTSGRVKEAGPGGDCSTAKVAIPWTDFTVPNGSVGPVAFFLSSEELTNDANTGAFHGGQDLYEYNPASGVLTDLSADSNAADSNGAAVEGLVGASANGSYVYFVANGVLASGAKATACSFVGASPCNLYALHEGAVSFVAPLIRRSDLGDWNSRDNAQSAQVSGDGADLLFTSRASLTPYENAGMSEIYLYESESRHLRCISCNPSGVAATAGAQLSGRPVGDGYQRHVNISSDGRRAFFQSTEALLPHQVAGGGENVYEWEAAGSGGCASTADNGGCLYLIASGGATGAYFEGVSANGEDAFFATRETFVGENPGGSVVLYDARVNGGFPAPPAATSCATVFGCHATQPSAGVLVSPGSELLSGPGNLAPPSTIATKTRRPEGGGGKHRRARANRAKLRRALKRCAARYHRDRRRRMACRRQARRRLGNRRKSSRHRRHSRGGTRRTGSSNGRKA